MGKAPLTVVTVHRMLLATIMRMNPEILEKTFKDGSKFQASDSFICGWLHKELEWSVRKATQVAQKLPENWEEQCERSVFRKVYIIKEEDIPPELYANSDQTQMVYAPGNKLTWAETGAKQVSLVGTDEKQVFTVMVTVTSNGTLLPLQAIYQGGTNRSCPASTSPHYHDTMMAGFQFEFVNNILAPYFDNEKKKLGRPPRQKALWQIDVWSVHCSKEFHTWMKQNHPIILDYVPGGCTSIHQPSDVGIQQPFKLSAK
jgi:hypothetical protein